MPIGIKFLPSEAASMEGSRQGQLEGLPRQAIEILSLRLPRRPAFRGIAPPELLQSRGAAGLEAGGFNPMAAVFEALLAAAGRGQAPGGAPGGRSTPTLPGQVGAPRVIPGLVTGEPGSSDQAGTGSVDTTNGEEIPLRPVSPGTNIFDRVTRGTGYPYPRGPFNRPFDRFF